MIISTVDRDALPAVFLDLYGHLPFLSLRLALMTSVLYPHDDGRLVM
jgi:hypothetical protein